MTKDLKEMNIILLSSFPPRECGIATYATHLFSALKKTLPELKIIVLAVDERKRPQKYEDLVKHVIKDESVESYQKAAEYINESGAGLVCLQHEFGIYGGFDGTLVIEMMKKIKVPIVTTLHTVPITKKAKRRDTRLAILKEIIKYSKRVLLTTEYAKECLKKEAGAPDRKLKVILHGTPDVKLIDPDEAKKKVGLEGKKVISTIGMINPHKGIEKIVEVLPAIVKKHKNVVYLIAGEVHPRKKKEVDAYLARVYARAKELGVYNHIKRVDKYFTEEELVTYFQASDIFMTIYDVPEQVSSGTLAYAIACGRCVVSTPYIYAKELIGEDVRGFLVKFGDLPAIASKVNYILDNPLVQQEMEKKIYEFGRRTTWEAVAKKHFEIFEEAVQDFF
ncbi:MAG: glycosyltransferase [Patescibacteria group bacterium]|nr:glycosyltransferase [Patescibacteria group bacterium]